MKRILFSIAVLALCASCSASGRLAVGLWGASVSYEWTVTPEPPVATTMARCSLLDECSRSISE